MSICQIQVHAEDYILPNTLNYLIFYRACYLHDDSEQSAHQCLFDAQECQTHQRNQYFGQVGA